MTTAEAREIYAAHLSQTSAASYPVRQQLHRELSASYGAVYTNMIPAVVRMFDECEQAANVSMTDWHGVKNV